MNWKKLLILFAAALATLAAVSYIEWTLVIPMEQVFEANEGVSVR